MLKDFTETELKDLISNQVEENLHLDYKGALSLQKTEARKKELAKDVSAFANSDGGTIVYGIREFDESSKKHLPERIDPIERNSISKEWIEQVINSSIQPRITGVVITPIQLSSSATHVVYVVTIPKSTTAHQCIDKKYYRRYNFESIAMEDYEIKDIINRQTTPVLRLVLDQGNTIVKDDRITMPILLMNESLKMARDVKMTLEINEPANCEVEGFNSLNDLSNLNSGRKVFGSKNNMDIYNGLSHRVGTLSLLLLNNCNKISFTSKIYADNISPIIDIFSIEILEDKVIFHTD